MVPGPGRGWPGLLCFAGYVGLRLGRWPRYAPRTTTGPMSHWVGCNRSDVPSGRLSAVRAAYLCGLWCWRCLTPAPGLRLGLAAVGCAPTPTVGVQVVAVPGLARAATAAAVVGDGAVAVRGDQEQLVVPRVGGERPAPHPRGRRGARRWAALSQTRASGQWFHGFDARPGARSWFRYQLPRI
jgi:hypothetical protein